MAENGREKTQMKSLNRPMDVLLDISERTARIEEKLNRLEENDDKQDKRIEKQDELLQKISLTIEQQKKIDGDVRSLQDLTKGHGERINALETKSAQYESKISEYSGRLSEHEKRLLKIESAPGNLALSVWKKIATVGGAAFITGIAGYIVGRIF